MMSQAQGIGMWRAETGDFSFIGLEDPDNVYQLIRRIQRGDG